MLTVLVSSKLMEGIEVWACNEILICLKLEGNVGSSQCYKVVVKHSNRRTRYNTLKNENVKDARKEECVRL